MMVSKHRLFFENPQLYLTGTTGRGWPGLRDSPWFPGAQFNLSLTNLGSSCGLEMRWNRTAGPAVARRGRRR